MHLEKLKRSLRSKLIEGVMDIILFGSSIKGRLSPGDIDLAVIVEDKADIVKVQRSFDDLREEIQITFVKFSDIINRHILLKQALVHEGFSIRFDKFVHDILGFEAFTLFTFSLKHLTQREKVRFQYALYGRGEELGLLQRVSGEKIAKGAIVVPVSSESEVEDFFKLWRVPFRKERILKALR